MGNGLCGYAGRYNGFRPTLQTGAGGTSAAMLPRTRSIFIDVDFTAAAAFQGPGAWRWPGAGPAPLSRLPIGSTGFDADLDAWHTVGATSFTIPGQTVSVSVLWVPPGGGMGVGAGAGDANGNGDVSIDLAKVAARSM